ncbi:hypothetical protein ScPMuIL_009747 [Solemya velum]
MEQPNISTSPSDEVSTNKKQSLASNSSRTASLPASCQGQLTDAGLFSYAGLCAVSLFNLFEDDWHKEFKKLALSRILDYLKQPKQVRDSIFALLSGHGMDECGPYVEVLLKEPLFSENCLPLITDLIWLSISDGVYDSRMRVLIKHVAWRLKVRWDDLEEVEGMLAEYLELKEYEKTDEELKEQKKKATKEKAKRIALIGLATVGGGALIGLTGGLAAPLVAAGAGVFIGGAGAAALGSTAGVAVIGSLFGVAGAGLTGYKMKRRVGSVEEFEFDSLNHTSCTTKQLHITMAITGWLTDDMTDFRFPWNSLAESREQYSLRWESKYLLQMGTAMDYIFSCAMTVATQEALKHTFLQGLLAAVAWPATLVSAASVIDNPWSVCCERAVAVGKILAEVLLAREQGKRPVTLIGYSLGARVIFSCLEEMAKRKGSEGIIEDVIMLGTPASGNSKKWMKFGRVVGGKIINGYCRGDWLLKFLYRTASVQFSIAGLAPIKWDNRRMHNIDLSDLVTGHKDYLNQLDLIMKVVGIRTKHQGHSISPAFQGKSLSDLSLDHTRQSITSAAVTEEASKSDPVFVGEPGSRSDLPIVVDGKGDSQSEPVASEPVVIEPVASGPVTGRGDDSMSGPGVGGKTTSDSDPVSVRQIQTGCDSMLEKPNTTTESRDEEQFHSIYDRRDTDTDEQSPSEDSMDTEDFVYVSNQSSESLEFKT